MSNAISVMNGASFEGAVSVTEIGLQGMITLRGDLGAETLAAGVKTVVGLNLPEQRCIKSGAKGRVAWMSPDELLLLVDYTQADAIVARLDTVLENTHFLAVNVSDARAMFTLKGAGVREVIAKGAPVDLSSDGLPIGEIRRSRLGQVAVAFWLEDAETLNLVCFRSLGCHVYDWLCNAAAKNTLPKMF